METKADPKLVIVVAMARNRVIGADGGMPWRLPTDLKHYRRLTMNRPMIMGRKTLESIGRVLDGRDTIVLTRDRTYAFEGATVVHMKSDALAAAAEAAAARGADEIVIAGGADIFELFLDDVARIEMTEIDASPAGDVLFPALDGARWAKLRQEAMPRAQGDSADASFVTYVRRENEPHADPVRGV